MRSRRSTQDQVAEVARRRLELLSAELAAIRPDPRHHPPSHDGRDGSGEPSEPMHASPERSDRPGRHAHRPLTAQGRLTGWLEERLPPALHGRVQIGSAHLALVATSVAAVMGFLAWGAVRAADPGELVPARTESPAMPEPLPLHTVAPSPGGAATGGAAGETQAVSDAGQGEVVVDVAGRVRRPGIVVLPLGSRVVDALEAAGGPRRGVDLTGLNLARLLVDGEQVLVGVRGPGGVAASAAASAGSGGGALVNLNLADQAALESLPGIGPVTAEAILQWRADHGSFSSVDELMEVSGIGEATLAKLAPHVTL